MRPFGQCQGRTCIIIISVFVCFLACLLVYLSKKKLVVCFFISLFICFVRPYWTMSRLEMYYHNQFSHFSFVSNTIVTHLNHPAQQINFLHHCLLLRIHIRSSCIFLIFLHCVFSNILFNLSTPSSSPVHHRRSANQFDPPLEDNVNAGPAFRKCSTNVDTPFHYVSILPLVFVSSFVCLFVWGLAMCCC